MSHERGDRSGLVVEFTGVTGAGKSTLCAAVKRKLIDQGFRCCEVNDLLLEGVLPATNDRRNGSSPLRTLLLNLATVPPFVSALGTRRGMELSRTAARIIARDAGSLGNATRLARNFVRRLGSQMFLARSRAALHRFDFVLWDEGIVHSVHNLFVHAGAPPRDEELDRFLAKLSLPDVLVHVTAPAEQSVACTVERGHSRVPDRREAAETFVARAAHVFRRLGEFPAIRERMLTIDNAGERYDLLQGAIDRRATEVAELLTSIRRKRLPFACAAEEVAI